MWIRIYFSYKHEIQNKKEIYKKHRNVCVCVCDGNPGREMDTVIQVQILDSVVCISHSVNTLGKYMNPILLPPAMDK